MALTERLEKTTQAGYWTGQIPLEYIYTYGRAGEAYFRNLMEDGSFLAAQCDRCGISYVPPRIYCERCFDSLEGNFKKIAGRGNVHTFTIINKNLDGTEKDKPTVIAMINLEGVLGGVVHYIDEIEPDEVYFEMIVEPVLKPKDQRKGGILDIEYFKPVD